jgi:hypothetical protein
MARTGPAHDVFVICAVVPMISSRRPFGGSFLMSTKSVCATTVARLRHSGQPAAARIQQRPQALVRE